MAQLTLYVDEETARRIEEAARKGGISVSRWEREHLKAALDRGLPGEFFELFGSVCDDDDDLRRPEQLSIETDAAREEL